MLCVNDIIRERNLKIIQIYIVYFIQHFVLQSFKRKTMQDLFRKYLSLFEVFLVVAAVLY